MTEPVHIALVDDDSAVLDSLLCFFARREIKTSCFVSVEAFLAAFDGGLQPECIVSDVRLTGQSGLDLVHRLNERRSIVPVILMTGVGDISMAVSAMRSGAFDFIEKPFDERHLLAVIRGAVEAKRLQSDDATQIEELRSRFNTLSTRQRQVMELAVAGLSNKEIASQLDISAKTVENHRAWVMERMDAKNLVELVRIALKIKERPKAANVR